MYILGCLLSSPFFILFETLFFRLLLGVGQNFVRLSVIRVEAMKAIMHHKGISGSYDNLLRWTLLNTCYTVTLSVHGMASQNNKNFLYLCKTVFLKYFSRSPYHMEDRDTYDLIHRPQNQSILLSYYYKIPIVHLH